MVLVREYPTIQYRELGKPRPVLGHRLMGKRFFVIGHVTNVQGAVPNPSYKRSLIADVLQFALGIDQSLVNLD